MRSAARAVTTAAMSVAALTAPVAHALAAPTPTPPATSSPSASPTLPTIRQSLDPARSIGGPRLAEMNAVIVDLPPGVPPPPAVADVAWVIADAETGEILAAKNPHAHLLPASTLKVFTALHLLPRIKPTAVLTATALEAGAEGTRVGMVPGQTYTAAQLFQALVMSSGNDAAYGLAALNGGIAPTVAQLNVLAAQLGAHDTVIVDPSGLDSPGQRSSAYDLALVGRAAIADPAYVKLATTRTAAFPGAAASRGRASYAIGNHNRLVWNYPGTLGVKNGFTRAAHRTFIGAARRGDRTYIVTEMYGTGSSWRPAASLLDWAFAHGESASPVGRLVERGEVPEPLTAAQPRPPAPSPATPRPTSPAVAPQPEAAALPEPSGTVHTSMLPFAALGGLVLLLVGLRATRGRLRRRQVRSERSDVSLPRGIRREKA
ncbi:D-alanyl-D-alanine carboxypeptidase family protein [Knoellia sp. CPCC 206435]|uniref:D-alanyl-D-alanine carboxypeptidase family protein n=1 Tax=Knoellia terrae TaxID=3404797 RepID=UPI003B434626